MPSFASRNQSGQRYARSDSPVPANGPGRIFGLTSLPVFSAPNPRGNQSAGAAQASSLRASRRVMESEDFIIKCCCAKLTFGKSRVQSNRPGRLFFLTNHLQKLRTGLPLVTLPFKVGSMSPTPHAVKIL